MPISIESSCVELYSNQLLFDELNMFLGANGFGLARVFNECVVPSVGLVQADYLYKKLTDLIPRFFGRYCKNLFATCCSLFVSLGFILADFV